MAQAGGEAERVLAVGTRPAASAGLLLLFAATLLLSALLLFWLQPMFTRMVLPRLGGSPAVWNTAMVFFQTALPSPTVRRMPRWCWATPASRSRRCRPGASIC